MSSIWLLEVVIKPLLNPRVQSLFLFLMTPPNTSNLWVSYTRVIYVQHVVMLHRKISFGMDRREGVIITILIF